MLHPATKQPRWHPLLPLAFPISQLVSSPFVPQQTKNDVKTLRPFYGHSYDQIQRLVKKIGMLYY